MSGARRWTGFRVRWRSGRLSPISAWQLQSQTPIPATSLAPSSRWCLRQSLTAAGNTRLRRVLAKWRAGKPVRLGVIGGSNSAGQGVWDDNKMQYSKLNMHVRLFNYLDSLFPQSGGSVMERTGSEVENSFVNSAQFGKGTEYFVMCSEVHLPEDLDLIVVEFGEWPSERSERGG